jgi:tRNA pseudouridine38-40 synthase
MPRYFLELSYKGTNYSGFQVQKNANTVQAELEAAFNILQKGAVQLTGSSRTDAGVHALQNYFHFDYSGEIDRNFEYKINAILPGDIVIKKIIRVKDDAHCRFDAISRKYKYFIYREKNPFQEDRAYYFPYKIDIDLMHEAADIIKQYSDFTSFSKRNTQVKTFLCKIENSEWQLGDNDLTYQVKGDRFLRGMVRALTATMLKIGRHKISLNQFKEIIEKRDCTQASFASPAHGLFLAEVNFSEGYFE